MGHSRGKCVKGKRVCLGVSSEEAARRGGGRAEERGRGCVPSLGDEHLDCGGRVAPERVGGRGACDRRGLGGRGRGMLRTGPKAETWQCTATPSARGRRCRTGLDTLDLKP